MRDEADRPVHRDYNVSTGVVTNTPVTDEEWDEMERRDAAELKRRQTQALADEQLRAVVAAHPDPVVQELARRSGLA